MNRADSLIHTKMRMPFIRPGLISRGRLQEQVWQGIQGPLTLVIAPAGFGKTTLVASSIASCGMPVAWLSLDKNDNQAGRFLVYLIAALQTADQRIGNEAILFIRAPQPAPVEAVLTCLINDLENSGTELVLVMDDYHFITSQAVHEQVTFLLEHCPRSLHLLISSRSDPALPLSRLRARGQTLELRAADLRFSEIEASEFLNNVMGLQLDAASAALLEERTEGWVAGLQMAALSMRDRKDVAGFVAGFSGTNRYILEYLLEEVLASQPPEIQHFLLFTSILDRLTAPLCDAVLKGDSNPDPGQQNDKDAPYSSQSANILKHLERENIFLVLLDDEGTWFRYHHLFADLLRAHLQQIQENIVPILHIRAADWLEQQGFIQEAIQHLIAAEAYEQAADLIERYGSDYWINSDPSIVQMADNLPVEVILKHPKIGLYQVWLLIIQGQIAKALPLMDSLSRSLSSSGPNSKQQWMNTFITLAAAFLAPPGPTAGSVPLPGDEAVGEIPADELVLRDAAAIIYGMALARRGETDHAVDFSFNYLRQQKIPREVSAIPTLVPFLAHMLFFQGRLQESAAFCREYLDPINNSGYRFLNSVASLNTLMGEVLYERNHLDEAEQQIREALLSNEPWQNVMTFGFGLPALARVQISKGDYHGAGRTIEKFEACMQRGARPREFDENFFTLRVRLQVECGDLQGASQWAEQIRHTQDFQIHPDTYRMTLAHIYLACGRYAEVEEILAGGTPPDNSGSRVARELERNLLLAGALAGKDRLPEAFELLEASLVLAEPEGYLRTFLNAGRYARKLLAAYLRTPAPRCPQYAQTILNSFSTTTATVSVEPQSASLVEPLSRREIEVLNLVANGSTNQEIARQLVVSPGTVKAHTASIYRKLDAANRTEAVARARQLGILP